MIHLLYPGKYRSVCQRDSSVFFLFDYNIKCPWRYIQSDSLEFFRLSSVIILDFLSMIFLEPKISGRCVYENENKK